MLSGGEKKLGSRRWRNVKIVESLCVGRKLDYFARKEREGWTV